MKIAIAGGTGFVGKALTSDLLQNGHEVFILSRNPVKLTKNANLHFIQWLSSECSPENFLQDVEVFINLAGESINSGRWTLERKRTILQSRLKSTEAINHLITKLHPIPKVLINASAVGIYGTSLSKTFTELNTTIGSDFLAQTVDDWEQKASEVSSLGIRTIFCRFGIILDKSEGALPRITMPYKFFAGGTVGSGEQWVSWIHLADVIKAIQFAMTIEEIHGPVNFTAPHPVKMKEFGKTVGSVLHRPHWLPAPSLALRLALGEMSTLVLEGQKVLPEKLEGHGYQFSYPSLKPALENIF
jgi:uncharacterized protein